MKKVVLVFSAVLLLIGCAKDGKDGVTGQTGTSGVNGNANVQSAGSIALTSGNWTSINSSYYSILNVAEVTQDVVDNGVVMVYINRANGWSPMPLTAGVESYTFEFRLNEVIVWVSNTDGSQTANPGNENFRVVVIPSSQKANGVDYNDYKNVMEVYNLKE